MNNKRFLLYLFFFFLGFGRLSVAQQAPTFPIQSSFPIYQPSCSGCSTHSAVRSLSGDFNGDGKADLAYIEIGAPDPFIVVLFGVANGQPNQVATDLKSCSPTLGAWAAADVNKDGHLDLVLGCTEGYTATLLGNGDGTFQAPILSPVTGQMMALADFNQDGLPDIAYANASVGGSNYVISLNSGGGHFAAPKTYSLPSQPRQIAAGDFNGDGRQDLVFGTGYVLGNGDGTFGQEQTLTTGTLNLVVGDFNRDGFSDLVYTLDPNTANNPSASPIYFQPGGPSGLTSPPVAISSVTVGFQDANLIAIDLTGNGNLDLIASLGGTSIFFGDGKGSFSSPLSYAFSTSTLADVNGDGVPDLVALGSQAVSVAYGNGDGTQQAPPLTLGASLGAFLDMNGDGLPDVVSKNRTNVASPPQVYLSTGDGRFAPAPVPSTSATDYGQIIEAADFTGDGRPDVISISTGYAYDVCHGGCPSRPKLAQVYSYRGNGDGTLTFLQQMALGVETVTGVVTGDFNRDGKQDFVLTYYDGFAGTVGGAIFVAGNGDGTFAAPVSIPLLGTSPTQVITADLNGDGKLDLVITDYAGTLITYLGNGDGTFSSKQVQSLSPGALQMSDVTGDGIPDMICYLSPNLEVFAGVGDGSFSTTPVFTADLTSYRISNFGGIQIGDLNGDGLPDIVIAFDSLVNGNNVGIFFNQGNGSFVADSNLYPYQGSLFNGFALGKLNAKASSTPHPSLDFVAETNGLASLLNLRNPAPAMAPSVAVSTANGQTAVTAGQTITLNAGVTAFGKNTPSGTVNFLVNQKQVASSPLSQNQASAQIKIAGTGAIAIQAVYSGDSNYPGASGFLTLTSTAAATTTTLTSSASTAAQGTNITFTAAVTPATATGTVSFMDSTTTLGTANLSSGSAVYATAGLAVGSHTITAVYSGDANDAASTSSATVVTITPATYQLSANPTTLNIAQGGTGSTTITATPTGAYNGTVALSCTGLPAYSTCAFAPASVTFNGTSGAASQTSVLTIVTNVSTTALLRPYNKGFGSTGDRRILFASFFLLPGALLMNLGRRRGFIRLITVILLVGGVFLSLSGCSGGSAQQTKGPVTPAGTSRVTVSSSASSSVPSLTLTVNISQ